MKPSVPTTILMALLSCAAFGQTKADPFKPTNATAAKTPASTAESDEYRLMSLSSCFEVFTMPMSMATAMLRENLSDEECYKLLVGQPADSPVIQEVVMVLRSLSGQKAVNQSVVEEIYPTEYDSHEAPKSLTLGSVSGDKGAEPIESIQSFYPPITPTAFDTRNTGNVLELEISVSDNNEHPICEVRMAPELELLVGKSIHGTGANRAEMPIFETRRLLSSFQAPLGKPFLIGTLSRPVNSKSNPNAANTVSFAFITIKPAR